jgi:hypothetical protein
MKRAAIFLLALTGCPSSRTLWLAPDQNETHVKLVDHEPPPF